MLGYTGGLWLAQALVSIKALMSYALDYLLFLHILRLTDVRQHTSISAGVLDTVRAGASRDRDRAYEDRTTFSSPVSLEHPWLNRRRVLADGALMPMSRHAADVPECYVGLWRRRLLQDARGVDLSSEVFWLQSGRLYVDIRIPALRSAAPARLMKQQGFAGALEVEGSLLTWRRWIDFQPPGGPPDVGRMRFTRIDEMVEEGVHAEYCEIWERVAHGSQNRASFSLQVEYPAGGIPRRRAGVLVIVGDHFMYALDRLEALPPATDLAALWEDHTLSAPVRDQLLACEIAMGRRQHGSKPWEIILSTLPGREGQSLFEVHGALQRSASGVYEQRLPDGAGRRVWRRLERGNWFDDMTDQARGT